MSNWRVGGKVALNVYEGNRPMFQCHTPEDAARIVALLNRELEPAPTDELLLTEQKHALEELQRLRSDILSGELAEIMAVGFHVDGIRYKTYGGSTRSKHRMAGVFLELAVERVTTPGQMGEEN